MQTKLGDDIPPGGSFARAEMIEIQIGELPGIVYGYALMSTPGVETAPDHDDPSVTLRQYYYIATDGEYVYLSSMGCCTGNQRDYYDDARMMMVEPATREILANMHVPLPIGGTLVKKIRLLQQTALTGAYLSQVQVDRASLDQVLAVTGISVDGMMFQVECPNISEGQCWIPNDPNMIEDAGEY
jgi:hypothetical protein